MKKYFICFILAITTMVLFIGQAFAAIPGYVSQTRPVRVYINDNPVNLTLPILNNNGRTLYPFRELLESLGAQVSYDSATKTAMATYDSTVLKFPIGSGTYYVNGAAKTMDTKAVIDPASGRTYIPIRYAFEALGYTVQWITSEKHDEIRIYNLGDYSVPDDQTFLDKYYNSQHTDNMYYTMDTANHKLVFSDQYSSTQYKDVTLDTTVNPDINRMVYDVTKVLADDKQYVYDYYSPDEGDGIPSDVGVLFAKGLTQVGIHATYFGYTFYDKSYYDLKKDYSYDPKDSNKHAIFSDKVFLSLDLNQLFWGIDGQDHQSKAYYEKKLRDSLVALFGETTGVDIYQYVYEQYIRERASDDINYYRDKGLSDTKTFGNIKVDYLIGASDSFYFSYVD